MTFYTVEELSGILKISQSQVRSLIACGKLRSYRFSKGKQGCCRVSDEQLREFLESTEAGEPPLRPRKPKLFKLKNLSLE